MSEKYRLFQYCHVQQKVVPIHEVKRERQARDLFIQDEMEPTRNPLNPNEVFTSKRKLRDAYKSAGVVEVGDAYERGYIPENESKRSEKELSRRLTQQVIERFKHGR